MTPVFSWEGVVFSLVIVEGKNDGNATETKILMDCGGSGGQPMSAFSTGESINAYGFSQSDGVEVNLVGSWERNDFYAAVLKLAEWIKENRNDPLMDQPDNSLQGRFLF